MPRDSHDAPAPSTRCQALTNGGTCLQGTNVSEREGGDKVQWLVVVVFETDCFQQSETLAAALEAILDDIHPLGALADAERALVALRRRARRPSEAAFSVLEEMELGGFDPDAILAGREGAPEPAFSMERVA